MVPRAHNQSLSAMLRRSARRHRDRPAIICGTTQWSYREFDEIVDQLAAGLAALGTAKGDRVAILARNSHAFMAVRFAVARIGAILVPINFMLTAEEVRYILEHSGAKSVFVDRTTVAVGLAARPDTVEMIVGLPGEHSSEPVEDPVVPWQRLLAPEGSPESDVSSHDIAQIIYTSGTESKPKGAMLSHGAILWQYQSCIIDCEWTVDTIALHSLPLFHCAQLDAMIGPAIHIGATNIITADPSPDNLIPLLALHRVNSFFAPPTVWIALLRSSLMNANDLSHLVKGYYGASIMPVEILTELRRRLPALRLWNLYGQTEIAPVATVLFPEEHAERSGSAGRPTLHVETRVVTEAMQDVKVGEIGEIVHRSPQLLDGYWRDPERTAEAFSGNWFHSGDLATMDKQGYITIVDRKKDMIKSGGENVSSREVEECIYGIPGVSEVAVIGLPDPKWVEAVAAFVVLRQDAQCSQDDVVSHCAQRIAGFKVPKRIFFRDSLPKNASGKILKRDLRQQGGN